MNIDRSPLNSDSIQTERQQEQRDRKRYCIVSSLLMLTLAACNVDSRPEKSPSPQQTLPPKTNPCSKRECIAQNVSFEAAFMQEEDLEEVRAGLLKLLGVSVVVQDKGSELTLTFEQPILVLAINLKQYNNMGEYANEKFGDSKTVGISLSVVRDFIRNGNLNIFFSNVYSINNGVPGAPANPPIYNNQKLLRFPTKI